MRRAHLIAVSLGLLSLGPRTGVAQTAGVVQGIVRGETGTPLADVRIGIMGTMLSAVTRSDGRYAIANVPAGDARVRARRIGYAVVEKTVTVGSEPAIADFQLKQAAVSLDQVVVTGYGSTTKKDVTGSISSVSANDFSTMPVVRVDQAISGLVSGVQVQTTNAQPGSQMRLRVRGGNSLNASNEPLVVADGVIGVDMNQVNPNDIESVEILKDASATAIYGARASNGVILLTTKRGHGGRMRFEYSGYSGSQTPTKYIDVLDANQFALLYMRNPNRDKSITFDTTKTLPTTNWQRLVYGTAPMESHELRISGSNDGTSLMVSAGWLNQQGIVHGSSYQRGNLRVNLDQDLGTKVRAGTRMSYSRTTGNEVRVNDGYGSAGGPITMMALRFAPTIAAYDSLGGYSGPLLASQTMDNPLAIAALRDDKTTTDYVFGNAFAEYRPLAPLTLRTSLGYTSSDAGEQRYTSRLLRAALNSGQANIDNTRRTTWLTENTADWRTTFARHHEIDVLAGATAQQSRRQANSEQGIGFTSDLLGYRRLNLAETVTGSSSSSRERLVSVLGRVNYTLLGRYLLTASVRSDGSSKFAANNKWATFPSVALAWRASEEPFFRSHVPLIDEMKLRASYGQTGSEAIGAYESLASWSVGSIYSIGTTTYRNGAKPSRIANPNLKWETTSEVNVGLDLALLQNRIGFTADAYHKRTNDLLYTKQVPYVTGFESYTTNIGSIQNRGLEMEIDTRQSVGVIDLRLGGNISFNRSKVLSLGGDKEFLLDGVNGSLPRFRPAAIVRVGEPLGNFYGYKWDGIFQDSASAANSGQAGARVGGMKLKDINGRDASGKLTGKPDGKIDSDDRTILGNAQPRYMFAQTGSIGYRSLAVSYLLRGVQGFKVANLNRQGMETPGGDSNMLPAVLNYWSTTNPTNKMTAIGVGPFDGMTDRWIEDGSFVRLQNVTLSWSVPRKYAVRVNADELRLYVSGQNLFTHTKYSWYDPEVSSRGTSDLDLGWDDSSYPGVRTITIGWTAIF